VLLQGHLLTVCAAVVCVLCSSDSAAGVGGRGFVAKVSKPTNLPVMMLLLEI
jgi:hypothetical protein